MPSSPSPPATLDDDQAPIWRENDEPTMGPSRASLEPSNPGLHDDLTPSGPQDSDNIVEYTHGSSVADSSAPKADLEPPQFREKQVKPNKVYIGGLPEHTRQEDLQNCFGKIGHIVAIELKIGYGFVEFESREAAELSVSKYHEGTFMGNKIRVELSRGGGRTAKYSSEPGACFRCGRMGHWARECPLHPGPPPSRRLDPPPIDPMSRDFPPPRDVRYDHPPRDYRRPATPPRDYYPPMSSRPSRYDDPRERDRYAPPPMDYRHRYPEPSYRGPPPPPPASYSWDRAGRDGRWHPPPASGRPRTPPRYRDDYPPPRDYPEYRGRPITPPRYAPDYPRGPMTPERYPRRSASPPARSNTYEYTSGSQNGYPSTPPGPPPRSSRDYGRGFGRDAPPDTYRRV